MQRSWAKQSEDCAEDGEVIDLAAYTGIAEIKCHIDTLKVSRRLYELDKVQVA